MHTIPYRYVRTYVLTYNTNGKNAREQEYVIRTQWERKTWSLYGISGLGVWSYKLPVNDIAVWLLLLYFVYVCASFSYFCEYIMYLPVPTYTWIDMRYIP